MPIRFCHALSALGRFLFRPPPVGARSRATGVARRGSRLFEFSKASRRSVPLCTLWNLEWRTRKDGFFETCDAGRAGARPYRRKPASLPLVAWTRRRRLFETGARTFSGTCRGHGRCFRDERRCRRGRGDRRCRISRGRRW